MRPLRQYVSIDISHIHGRAGSGFAIRDRIRRRGFQDAIPVGVILLMEFRREDGDIRSAQRFNRVLRGDRRLSGTETNCYVSSPALDG